MAQLDSDISKLLVHLGGADSSVLKHELLSPSPTRNVNAVLHGPCPRSPLSRRKQERPESLRSLSTPNGLLYKTTSPSGTMGDMLTVESPSSRGSSRASSLDDLEEDENEEEEEREYMQYYSNLNKNRRNSLSLPDLRDMPDSLVATSAAGSLTSSMEQLSLRKSNSAYGSQNFKHPLLIEEDADEEADEQFFTLNQIDKRATFKVSRHRKNSVSLPDLRERLQDIDDDNSIEDNSYISDEDIPSKTHSVSTNKRINSNVLTHRKQQFNKMAYKRDSVETFKHKDPERKNRLSTRDKYNKKQLLNLNFKT